MTEAERQTLLDIRAAIDAVLGIASLNTETTNPPSDWPVFADDADLKTPGEVAGRFGVDPSTIRRWAEEHGIGKRYGGRWRVSIRRLKAYLDDGSQR